ncbi:invasion associated locus B family protein [Xanthobacter agilis]|uniref:invasion associated locus B family protein n=1 Tax=Xanthobacter agilis TaxID=47492 RepID=UPI003727AA0D
MTSPARLRSFRILSAWALLLAGVAAAGTGQALSQTAAPAQSKKPTSAPAAPAEGNTPQATTATYGDWVVRCSQPQPQDGAKGGKVCEAATGVQAQGQQGILAQVVVGRMAKDQPVRLVVQLPNGVFLPPGATLYLDEKAQGGIDTVFSSCPPRGCFADAELKADQLAALKSAKGPGRLEFVNGARKRLAVSISFNGFTAALDTALNPRE